MTDEQIIKALECCATDDGDDCFQCPYGNIVYKPGNGGCVNRCRKDALDLINRQKEKIKEFDGKIVIQQGMIDYQKAEIEQWKEEANRWQNAFVGECMLTSCEAKSEIAVETIKEFAERLCKGRVENDPVVIAVKSELKEMEGGNSV